MWRFGCTGLCVELANKVVEFLNDPKLGLPAVRGLFEQFKEENCSKDDEKFLENCLKNLEFEVIGGNTSRTGIYMEVSLLCCCIF